MKNSMKIERRHLPLHKYARPGIKRKGWRAVVIHYPEASGWSADRVWRYFAYETKTEKRHASAHYIVGNQGEILEIIPRGEIAYSVGADQYTNAARRAFRSRSGHVEPNFYTTNIEVTHLTHDAKPTMQAYASLVWLTAKILREDGLTEKNIWLHTHINPEKICHKYYVENPAEFSKFREDVKAAMQKRNPAGAFAIAAGIASIGVAVFAWRQNEA